MRRIVKENATEMGDIEFSKPIYACRKCGKKFLSWGALGPHRRLFESPGVVHDCPMPVKKRCACDGFGDFTIGVEHYNDPRTNRT